MKTLLIAASMGFLGISLIAEQTVPGDLLYPIKINVNENARHIIAIGSRAEAELALRLLRERMSEAEVLADDGVLTPETAVVVGDAIAAQAAKTVSAQSAVSTEKTRQELSKTLESFKDNLKAYQNTLLASTTEKLIEAVDNIPTEVDLNKTEEIEAGEIVATSTDVISTSTLDIMNLELDGQTATSSDEGLNELEINFSTTSVSEELVQ